MKKILVIGSANMDLSLNVYRVPEAGETLTDNGGVAYTPGGKGANAAAALAKLGADATFCAKLGQDMHGKPFAHGTRQRRQLLKSLKKRGNRHREILKRVKIALSEGGAIHLCECLTPIGDPLNREMKHVTLIGLVAADVHIVKLARAKAHQGIGA